MLLGQWLNCGYYVLKYFTLNYLNVIHDFEVKCTHCGIKCLLQNNYDNIKYVKKGIRLLRTPLSSVYHVFFLKCLHS